MPSPIAHVTVGYAIGRIYTARRSRENTPWTKSLLPPSIVAMGLSLLPDLDFIPGLLLGDFDRFHNMVANSLFLGLLVALIIGALVSVTQRSRFTFWFVLVLLCYESHVIMDFFTVGRGVMLLWPFSLERYKPAIGLFYGLHRSDGWLSIRHLWTLITELGFAVLIALLTRVVLGWLPKDETT